MATKLPAIAKSAAEESAQAVKDSVQNIAQSAKKTVSDSFKTLVSPKGIGGATAAVTRSPMAGLAVSGSLSAAGSAAKGVGNFGKKVMDKSKEKEAPAEPQEQQSGQLTEQQEKTAEAVQYSNQLTEQKMMENEQLWDMLEQIIDYQKTTVSAQEKQTMEQQRQNLLQVEQQRELSRYEDERLGLLQEIVENTEGVETTSEDGKKGMLGGLFSRRWLDTLKGALLTLFTVKLPAMIRSLGSRLKNLLPKKFTAAIAGYFSGAFVNTLTKALGKAFTALAIGDILYDTVKSSLRTVAEGGSLKDTLYSAATSYVESLKDWLPLGLDKAFEAITTGLGKAYAHFFTSDFWKSLKEFDLGGMLSSLWEGLKSVNNWIGEQFSNLLGSVADFFGLEFDWIKEEISDWKEIFSGIGQRMAGVFNESISGIQNYLQDKLSWIPGVSGPDQQQSEKRKQLDQQITQIRQQKDQLLDGRNLTELTGEEKQQFKQLNDKSLELTSERMNMARGAIVRGRTPATIGEAQPELVSPLHRLDDLIVNPAIESTLNMVRKQEQNAMYRLGGSGGGSSQNQVNAPITNNVVTQKQATPFVAPKSKRNNENTLQRLQEHDMGHKLI